MSKKRNNEENYLERTPKRALHVKWEADENGIVTFMIENKGLANKIAQKLLKKPKVSYIHLDETGSFIWQQLDGVKDIEAIGKDAEKKFGEKITPLYERLAKYIQILESYGFIEWK